MEVERCLTLIILYGMLLGNSHGRPNIVTIIADDMGWNDVGFHGSDQIPTPNIDALAYSGVILNRHYTQPTCTPSRTAYFTGRYPIRTGMQGYPLKAGEPRGLPLDEVLMPQRLKQLGYTTHIVGKWHQGCHRTEFTPTRRGFDSFLGYWNGFNGYFNHRFQVEGYSGYNFRRDVCTTRDYEGQYATDAFTEEAVAIIRRQDKSRPLYLHLAHLAVHTGNADASLEVPDEEATHKRFSYIDSPERRLYAGMVSKLDDSVGSVVRALSDRGILNNTIVLFFADNGAMTVDPFGQPGNSGSNWPLKGMKFGVHEGGVRSVAAVWSSMFHQPGRVSNQLFHLTDWLPTLYSAAGGNISDLGQLDGVDQWSSLVNNQPKLLPPRNQLLVNIDDVADNEALISDNWKISRGVFPDVGDGYYGDSGHSVNNPPYNVSEILKSDVNIALGNGVKREAVEQLREAATINCNRERGQSVTLCKDYCLFDIVTDPCEIVDLAAGFSLKRTELIDALKKFRSEAVAQINQPVDPASNPSLHGDTWVSWLDDPGSLPSQCNSKDSKSSTISTANSFNLVITFITLAWIPILHR